MNRYFFSLLMLCVMVACVQPDSGDAPKNDDARAKIINASTDAVRGSLLVKLEDYATEFIVEDIEGLAIESRPLFPAGKASAQSLRNDDIYRWWLLSFDHSGDLDAVALALAADRRVRYVEFNTIMEHETLDAETTPERYGVAETTTRATMEDMPVNDPYIVDQWHYYNDGSLSELSSFTSHKPNADINLFPAWKYSMGDSRVVVAVIDGGVKHTHADLADNMWVNEAEKSGSAGVDDDGNGYVDDIYGYNFNDNTGEIYFDNHGTHVAGTIAAVTNNGIGVAGIAGGSGNGDGCRIMSCQIYKSGEPTTTNSIAAAIKYAADNGAVIMNNSWAYSKGAYTSDSQFKTYNGAIVDATEYFYANAKLDGVIDGGIGIFCAGNDGYGVPSYPGAYYNNISVTSFGPSLAGASYTNYGTGANICAPGGEDGGWNMKVCSTYAVNYEYGYEKGTSMATPHVAGCAALGLAYAMELGKSFTREEYVNLILTSVHDINEHQTTRQAFDYITGTYPEMNIEYLKGKLGAGYIDAHLLLMNVEGTPCLYLSTGKEQSLSLDSYFGGGSESLTYTNVEMSSGDMSALGITTMPTVSGGVITLKCSKAGIARIRVTAIVGGSAVGGGNNMGGMEVVREFEIVARGSVAENGGWL